jgi:hypothetical protein
LTAALLIRALTRNRASTDPASDDPALRGRTYAIAFDRVWQAALELADGGLRGWSLSEADDQAGVLRAEATTRIFRFVDDVRVRVGLDADGQTRVDVMSASRKGKGDLGTNRRRIVRFLAALDRKLDASPATILTPRTTASR